MVEFVARRGGTDGRPANEGSVVTGSGVTGVRAALRGVIVLREGVLLVSWVELFTAAILLVPVFQGSPLGYLFLLALCPVVLSTRLEPGGIAPWFGAVRRPRRAWDGPVVLSVYPMGFHVWELSIGGYGVLMPGTMRFLRREQVALIELLDRLGVFPEEVEVDLR